MYILPFQYQFNICRVKQTSPNKHRNKKKTPNTSMLLVNNLTAIKYIFADFRKGRHYLVHLFDKSILWLISGTWNIFLSRYPVTTGKTLWKHVRLHYIFFVTNDSPKNGLSFSNFTISESYCTDLDNYWFKWYFLNLYVSNPNSLSL